MAIENVFKFDHYVSKERFDSYGIQVQEIRKTNPSTVLEVGCGLNIVKKILSGRYDYKTLDYDSALNPDIVGDVLQIPLESSSFDTVVCCQVLEHLPFESFPKALSELNRVSKNNIVLSLPYNHLRLFRIDFKIPLFPRIRFAIEIPRFWVKWKYNNIHHWEVGTKGHSYSKVRDIIRSKMILERDFVSYENPYHCFFVCRKRPE